MRTRDRGLGPTWLVLGLSGIAVGCGAGDAAPPATATAPPEVTTFVTAEGERTVTARIGPPGGRLELVNGARLDIPAGALSETIEVTFAIGADTSAFDRSPDKAEVGPPLIVIPPLTSEGPALGVSIPLLTLPPGFGRDDIGLATEEVDDQQRALGMGGTQTRWYINPARIADSRISGELSGVTGQRLQFVVAR